MFLPNLLLKALKLLWNSSSISERDYWFWITVSRPRLSKVSSTPRLKKEGRSEKTFTSPLSLSLSGLHTSPASIMARRRITKKVPLGLLKFIYSEKPIRFCEILPYFWLALHRTKVRWRFRKILWSSQNIWTLNRNTNKWFEKNGLFPRSTQENKTKGKKNGSKWRQTQEKYFLVVPSSKLFWQVVGRLHLIGLLHAMLNL